MLERKSCPSQPEQGPSIGCCFSGVVWGGEPASNDAQRSVEGLSGDRLSGSLSVCIGHATVLPLHDTGHVSDSQVLPDTNGKDVREDNRPSG